jgi:hypothetical protein
MELCATDKLRPNDAAVVAFGAMNIGPKKAIVIPPRKTKHTVTCTYPWLHGDVKFISAAPHMHKRGHAIKTETTDGRLIGEQKQFDFESQVGFDVDSEVHFGERVRTTCEWSNPDDHVVTFGEGTDDEMCFNIFTYYPKVGGILSWGQPAAMALCEEE